MTHNDVHELIDGFKLFPDPNDVFARDVALHCKYLLPLATIELAVVNPDISGRAHFIQPNRKMVSLVRAATSTSRTTPVKILSDTLTMVIVACSTVTFAILSDVGSTYEAN